MKMYVIVKNYIPHKLVTVIAAQDLFKIPDFLFVLINLGLYLKIDKFCSIETEFI
jgi:predicted Kef-type K+ transport protein